MLDFCFLYLGSFTTTWYIEMHDIYFLKLFVCFFLTFVSPLVFFFHYFERGRFSSSFNVPVCDSLWGCGELVIFLSILYFQQRYRVVGILVSTLFFFVCFVLFIEYCLWCFRKTKTLPRWDALRARTKTLKLFNSYCIWLCVCLIYIIYFFVLFVCLQLFCVFFFSFLFVTWWGFQFILVVSRKSTPNYLFEWEFDFSCFSRSTAETQTVLRVCFAGAHSSRVLCFLLTPPENPGFLFVLNCDSIIHLSVFCLLCLCCRV